MKDLGTRIQQLRKKSGMSQTGLANKIGISYAQIGRYETKGSQPPAKILKKIADTLGTTVDFLLYGDSEEKAKATINDNELLQQFKAVEEMNDEDRKTIKRLIRAFITQGKLKQIVV